MTTGTNGEAGDVEESARRSGKSESAFRTISEVSNELNVPQHVLRFWETKFSQIRPMKRGGGRRYYRPEDVTLLAAIRDLLYNDGYTIKGAQKLLRENGIKSVISHTEGVREGELPGEVDDREPTFAFDSDPKVEDPVPEEEYSEDEDESREDPLLPSTLVDVSTQPEGITSKPERLSQSADGASEAVQDEPALLGPGTVSTTEAAMPAGELLNEQPKAPMETADGNPSPLPISLEEGEAPTIAGLTDDQRLELEVVLSDLQDLRRILRQVDL